MARGAVRLVTTTRQRLWIATLPKRFAHYVDSIVASWRNVLRLHFGKMEWAPIDVVVSMTSYPERLPRVHHALRSVLAGSLRPRRVVLYLASDEMQNAQIPRALGRLAKNRIEIRVVDRNYLSANKLIHAIGEFPNCRIVTIDDDIIYPGDLVESLVRLSEANPGKVCAHTAVPVLLDDYGSPVRFLDALNQRPIGETTHAFPEGLHGVLYPPNGLAVDVFSFSDYHRWSATTDDIWFGAHAHRNGTSLIVSPLKGARFRPVPGASRRSLWESNSTLNLNDKSLRQMLDNYPELATWPLPATELSV